VTWEVQIALTVAGGLLSILVLWRIGYLFKKGKTPEE